jgi:hypothetical protein
MNIIKLLKNVRNQVIFNSLNGFTEQIKFKVKHLSKNLIVVEKNDQGNRIEIKNKILDQVIG